jgi:hypothetical protein
MVQTPVLFFDPFFVPISILALRAHGRRALDSREPAMPALLAMLSIDHTL